MNSEVIYMKVLPCIVVFLVITGMAVIWGMFLNALFLFSRDTNFLFTILEEPMELFSGVKVPTTLFPLWAKAISVIFPLTYAIEAARNVVLMGSTLHDIREFLGIGIVIIVILFTLIMIIVKMVERHLRKTGSVTLF